MNSDGQAMNVTLRQMRVFAEVASQGSVQRAAEALHLSAPAVEAHLAGMFGQQATIA